MNHADIELKRALSNIFEQSALFHSVKAQGKRRRAQGIRELRDWRDERDARASETGETGMRGQKAEGRRQTADGLKY
jgi:hypothetical protein